MSSAALFYDPGMDDGLQELEVLGMAEDLLA